MDWGVVALYFGFMLCVGLYFTRRASGSVADYFVSGRRLPWWIIALSAVATYTDAGLAPAVTMLAFQGGLLGNAVWWIPYIIWMPLGAVLWSKYWRRLGTVTSAELLGIRYSGRTAGIYRNVYAIFMSFGFIVVLIGYVSGWLGAALGPILGWSPIHLMLVAGTVAVIYTTCAGLYGVAYTDAFQFGIFLIGNIALLPVVLSHTGGLHGLHQSIAVNRGVPAAASFFRVLPPVPGLSGLTAIAFVVQGLFFAASPTGGEGFTAQRFMAARNEFHAQVGQLFNMVLTLIVRVIPFLILGMAAAAVYQPGSVAEPGELWARMVRSYAPTGLLGLLVAGVFAAYMATVSTHMNWGASYVINDFYRPLWPGKSEAHYVLVGRAASIVLFALGLVVAYFFVQGMRAWFLFINSVVFAFVLPLSWLRFFWWRLNIYGEATALLIGFPLSYLVWFPLGFSNEAAHPFWQGFLLLFGLGFLIICTVALLTPAEPLETLRRFHQICRPPGFWGPVTRGLDAAQRSAIARETMQDALDCCLGVAFAAASVLAVISPLAFAWRTFAVALTVAIATGACFIRRWMVRGVFRGMSGGEEA